MTYIVYFVEDAERDLFDIFDYIKNSGNPITAKKMFILLQKACLNLANFPERGRISPELECFGIFEFREIIIKVYRIIYQIIENKVYIHCIVDSRRDMQELLYQRILN